MTEDSIKARRAILEKVKSSEVSDKQELENAKLWACRKFELSKVPSNAEILELATEEEREEVIPILRRKPVRSISGVTVLTVMPEPYPCPKDDPCIYCPGGPNSGTPQSYTGEEPASARALELDYDPTAQIETRMKQLHAIGHKVDKVELIIFGGTFLAQPKDYQEEFIHDCLDAISGKNTPNLKTAKKAAENSETRNIGITFETRPDWCKKEHVNQMLRFGGTRVEIGVQTIYDDIYEIVGREHTVQDVIEATQIAKDSGLAIVYHMMPGLPGSNPERDLKAFETIFNDSNFMPDMLKIYPCLVTKGTELYEWWREGGYTPLEGEEAIKLVGEMKKKVPDWVRIQRVQRDIPSDLIEAGVKKGNFRVLVQDHLEQENAQCSCIRCREVGHKAREGIEPKIEDVELLTQEYDASGGSEIFLSYEDTGQDIILGYLRLRIPSGQAHRPEVSKETSLVRMLYVLGELVPTNEDNQSDAWQHKGFGKNLLFEAEKISRENYGMKEISILSGLGTRPYYRKFDYELEGPYMKKEL
ncbi:MAG: tRNA uridine(34) 5-carboxymethylaminomethyl modification radical SAM/GNAT enzyme Elp3 [Hadesarchaea archaeon]|nr:tRNA uridine(34) 5-carboxymethylaminomethyl modification radical SAM/GNAT enzyme Elp3 [Hadesarchaea archaeon]